MAATKRIKLQNNSIAPLDSEACLDPPNRSAQALLPVEMWLSISSFLNHTDLFRVRLVCKLFNQIFASTCIDLSLCVRLSPRVLHHHRPLVPFYQKATDYKTYKPKHFLSTGSLLVWSNEQKLFSRLTSICPQIQVLRLHQTSSQQIALDLKHLVRLVALKKLELRGFFNIVNRDDVHLPQIQSLRIKFEKQICQNIAQFFPNLVTLKCFYPYVYLQSEPIRTIRNLKLFNHLDSSEIDYFPIAWVCPNVEKLSIWIQTSLHIDFQTLTEMNHLKKLFLYCTREGLSPSMFRLLADTDEDEFSDFVPEIAHVLKEADETFDLKRIEFRVNGFQIRRPVKSERHPFYQFLRDYPWKSEVCKRPELDCRLADKARKKDLCRSFFTSEFNDLKEIEGRKLIIVRLFVDFLSEQNSLNDLSLWCPHLIHVHFHLVGMPSKGAADFSFLMQLSCLQRLCICKMPTHFRNDGIVQAIRTLPFFVHLCYYNIHSADFAVEVFNAFSAKAALNSHVKYSLSNTKFKTMLGYLKKLGNVSNLYLL